MNALEEMQAHLAALTQRVAHLELLFAGQRASTDDWHMAVSIGQEIGFGVDVLVLPTKVAERRRLAKTLKERGWSAARIARALGCGERTAVRWTE
jgi:Homeodomain-like domain